MNIKIRHSKIQSSFLKKSTDRKGYLLDNERFYKKPIAVNFFIYLQWSENRSNIE